MTRRWLLPQLALALAASACGGASSADEASASESGSVSTTPGEAATDAFPATIPHRHGETTIEERPERVVTDWYGDHPHAVWPWARDELGDAEPEIVGNATRPTSRRSPPSSPT